MSGYPYQIVTFLDTEPDLGEPVYYGERGWYPQIALKGRFKLIKLSENGFIAQLRDYLTTVHFTTIRTGKLVKPERMPVRVIELRNPDELIEFHNKLMNFLNGKIESKYPERDGSNYYPHITAEYDGKRVVDVKHYVTTKFSSTNVWLIKDGKDENSLAIAKLC